MKQYYFYDVLTCEMCGEATEHHNVIGQRLNTSQGLSPRNKTGISVSVKKCSNCKLVYASPLPIPFDIQDHYSTPPESYWHPNYFMWSPTDFAYQINTVKELLPFQENMKALDIGAGLGKAMITMEKAGFNTYGLEPSKPFFDRAITNMQIASDRLKLCKIEDADYPENTFDFITFGAVFEHLYHPAASLENALKWLKPNGIIHIEVPSSNYFISKLLNIYFKMIGTSYVTNISPMHAPFHLYEFDERSFEMLSKKLNFTIEKKYYDVCTISSVPKILHPLLKTYMKYTNTGMQLTVYLRKK